MANPAANEWRAGKISKRFFDEVIRPQLGAKRPEVVIGPMHGSDNAVIDVGDQVLVVTTDPLTIIPALGIEDSAWLTVHLIASDLSTSGLMPQYAVFDLNLPPHMSEADFRTYWTAIHRECARLGIAIVGGHTGKFFGCDYTIVGGGMMIAVGSKDRYVAPSMAQVGDHVIVTKGAAIGSTGILARVFPVAVAEEFGAAFQKRAAELFRMYSVVEDARVASGAGVRNEGVTAMHDATEGGVLGGLHELASAAGLGIRVRKDRIPVAEETRSICDLFEIDPYISLSEGALLIAVRPQSAERILEILTKNRIAAADVAEILPRGDGTWVQTREGEKPLTAVEVDPYWGAFARATEKGWK